jgi:hypothetical protein
MKSKCGPIGNYGDAQGSARSSYALLIRMALLIACFVLAIAPSRGQQMDPVRGPLVLQAPGPFFEATMRGPDYSIKSDFGRVRSWTFTDGETLKGKCETVTASSAGAQTSDSAGKNSPQSNLAAAWDQVNGPGYYAAHVAGNKILHGTFTGDKGTTLLVESLDNYVAVGVDNRGNTYKIVW